MRKFLTKKFFLALICCFSLILTNNYNANASEQVTSTQRQGIDVSVYRDGAGSIVKVYKNTITSIDKFSLTNPSRIIVDITGINLGRTEFIQVPNAPFIKMIRFGARSANVTRMVVDLNVAQIPQFNATLNQGTILMTIGNTQAPSNINLPSQGGSPSVLGATRLGDEQVNTLPSREEIQRPSELKLPTAPPTRALPAVLPTIAPTVAIPTPLPTVAIPTPLPTVAPVAPKMPEVDVQQDNIPTQEEELSNEGANLENCTLNSVSFDKDVSGSSIAKIKLNKKAKFKIETASKEIYKVIVPNCKLISDKLNFPYFPSSEYKKFVFIQANQINDNVEVTVAVEENTKLNYLQRDNEIWVKPQS